MNAPTAPASQSEFIFPDELSARIGIAVQTLARWRSEGRGPSFNKVGGKKVAYRWSAVEAWLELNNRLVATTQARTADR